jgi:hypothetical protein
MTGTLLKITIKLYMDRQEKPQRKPVFLPIGYDPFVKLREQYGKLSQDILIRSVV